MARDYLIHIIREVSRRNRTVGANVMSVILKHPMRSYAFPVEADWQNMADD